MVSYTKCPPRYKNVGLETFGNKKKVTEELLKQFCKNDEYLYQQIRILLDLTDPQSRKRFHPPYFEDEEKSFGYINSIKSGGDHNGEQCYMFNDGGEFRFGVNFNTKNDSIFVKEGITYYNDESIIDYNKIDGVVDIFTVSNEEDGYLRIHEETRTETVQTQGEPIYNNPKATTIETTKKVGSPKLDSYCYGPYGSMKPNGWWYVGFDIDKNYNIKPAWKKKPYTEGIPTVCRAQSFTARNTGYITKVNLNIISESNKKSASPFSCEIWKMKNGKPYGGAIARATKSFKDSNAYSGAHIKTFTFNKKPVVTKGHKYCIVMRSPLSYRDSCYRIAGWPRSCYTDYMKGTYYYGSAYVSKDNCKTWIKYDKNAYGKLHASKSTMPVAFGFEVYIQPTKTVKKTGKKPKKKIIGYKTKESQVEVKYYSTGNHYVYFNIPSSNPINQLTIDEGVTENVGVNGNTILWDISYNGEDFNNNDIMDNTMGRGTGDYDLSNSRPTFVTVRCNLQNTIDTETPILRSVKFTVHTDPTQKAFIRSLPYCPESETMLPACIWSEVNADYEKDNDNVSVKVDVVKETDATQTISIRKDSFADLWDYYHDYYPEKNKSSFATEDAFRSAIQNDEDFLNHLKDDLEPAVYVISSYPQSNPKYYEYFESLELRNHPAYPMVSCSKLLGEMTLEVEDFVHSNFNVNHTEYTLETNRDLSNDLVNIVFREPQNVDDKQEGVIENVLVEGTDYRISGNNIVFMLDGTNISKSIVLDEDGIKCFKLSDGTFEEESDAWDIAEADTDYVGEDYSSSQVNITTGDVIELVINLQDKAYNEHIHYTVDYENKLVTPRPSMRKDLSTCELLFTYNPLWVRDLTSDNLPLKMDLWTENFVVDDSFRNSKGKVEFTTRVAPRDNLREVVLFDEEDSLTRKELIEDRDFVVDYQKNKITFNYNIKNDTPITIRYTPNLIDNSLSLCYRLDRIDTTSQAYVYGNYFTTRT